MSKVRLKDMSYADRNRYRYAKRVLGDLYIYGHRYLKQKLEKDIEAIEEKYEENAE